MNHLNLKKRAMQLAAVLLSLAVLLPSVPAAFASQSAAEGTAVVFSESGITAAYNNGILEVTLPKQAPVVPESRQIAIL